jgi:membrane-associated protease RseP (regulator of RpoE activity)
VAGVWGDGALLAAGLSFSIPLLFILLCHEMGHYLACRYYRLNATLPYFLPLPVGLGTLGAFIKIKGLIRRKAELFDVGVAGPIAGFVALLPFLFYGVAHSTLEVPRPIPEGMVGITFGTNGALWLALEAFRDPLPDGMALRLHPTAIAAWVGLLATALNLLPLGQLDGGHILYATLGRWQRRVAVPLWAGLFAAGFLWPVWWVWCVFVLVMGLVHPPVLDEREPLDGRRKVLALVALVILLLSFTPVPILVVEG